MGEGGLNCSAMSTCVGSCRFSGSSDFGVCNAFFFWTKLTDPLELGTWHCKNALSTPRAENVVW